MPTGIDQSYGFADPPAARAAGVEAAMMYLSRTPGKNSTPQKVRAYHAVGIAVKHGWETTANRALEGYNAGLSDGTDAARQLRAIEAELGYRPKNHQVIAAAVDFDTNPSDYPQIDSYLRGFRDGLHAVAGGDYGPGVYGEADVIDHEHSTGLSESGFGTYAWSRGRISEWDDFHQFLNGQQLGGADVDFDDVRNPVRLGAWWPPGSKYDRPEPSPWEDNEVISPEGLKQISDLLDAKLTEGIVHARSVDLVLAGEDGQAHRLETVLEGIPGFKQLTDRGLALKKK